MHPRRQPTRDACQLQGAGDDDDDDDDEEVDEPFEDGSLCYFKCKPRQRKCIIKVLSVTPLKYQTEVAGGCGTLPEALPARTHLNAGPATGAA